MFGRALPSSRRPFVFKLGLVLSVFNGLVPSVGHWLPISIAVEEIEAILSGILETCEPSSRPERLAAHHVPEVAGRTVASGEGDDFRLADFRWSFGKLGCMGEGPYAKGKAPRALAPEPPLSGKHGAPSVPFHPIVRRGMKLPQTVCILAKADIQTTRSSQFATERPEQRVSMGSAFFRTTSLEYCATNLADIFLHQAGLLSSFL